MYKDVCEDPASNTMPYYREEKEKKETRRLKKKVKVAEKTDTNCDNIFVKRRPFGTREEFMTVAACPESLHLEGIGYKSRNVNLQRHPSGYYVTPLTSLIHINCVAHVA